MLDCVRRPHHATRVAVWSEALWKEPFVTAPLVLRLRTRQLFLQTHRTAVFVVFLLLLTMMASVRVLLVEVSAFHNT